MGERASYPTIEALIDKFCIKGNGWKEQIERDPIRHKMFLWIARENLDKLEDSLKELVREIVDDEVKYALEEADIDHEFCHLSKEEL